MTITRISTRGPSNNASGNVTLSYGTSPAVGNLLVLEILALSGQALPATISGWTTMFTNGAGGGYVSAAYTRVADGTETGNFVPVSATVATIAFITEYHTDASGSAVVVRSYGFGGDSNDTADGLTCTTPSIATAAADWLSMNNVYALSTPSFPSVPALQSGRTVTQSGATFGSIVPDAGTTWQTNHRYNLTHAPVTAGATAAVTFAANSGTTSLRGLTNVVALREAVASAPSNTAPTVTPGAAQTVTGTTANLSGSANDSNGTVSSAVWSLLSTDAGSNPTVGSTSNTNIGTASTTATASVTGLTAKSTNVFRLTATDNSGAVTTGDVTIYVSGTPVGPNRVISNAGGWTAVGAASLQVATNKATDDDSSWIETPPNPAGASIIFGVEPIALGDETPTYRMRYTGTGTFTCTPKLYSGSTLITTAAAPITLTSAFANYPIPLSTSENTAVANRTDVRVELVATQS